MKIKNTLESIGGRSELETFWTECILLRGPVGLMAFHGGAIEKGTEEMATYICGKTNCSLYIFSGRLSRANYEKLHIPSFLLNPAHSEKLASFMAHVETIVAFHGHRIDDHILVGGLNEALRRKIVEALSHLGAKDIVEDENPRYRLVRGKSLLNIVNRLPSRGVQIEIPYHLRQLQGRRLGGEARRVGDCLARLFKERD